MSTGTNVVVIDNVIRRLDSDSPCMAITATTIADRVTSKNSNRKHCPAKEGKRASQISSWRSGSSQRSTSIE
jgi:hypothetical protein